VKAADPADPLEYLSSLERLGMKFGLDNIRALTAALDHPEERFRSVIVAGTNGKGSVTAMIERGLRASGYRTGRYTSPHLVRLEERFAIDGVEITTDTLRRAAAAVRDVAEGLRSAGTLESPPTFFECATAIAFLLFAEARVDIAVLEVGLGGRLDATNVVNPIAAAITSIDFDHQAQLGSTIASIAREKAGVIKRGIPVVCGPLPPDAERVIREVSNAAGAIYVNAMDAADVDAVLAGRELSLKGPHQRANAAVALAILQQLGGLGFPVAADAMRVAISEVSWPGRLEEFTYHGARIWVDAAHNAAGARALAAFLTEIGWTDCALVFGAMQDKDAAAMLGELVPVVGMVICTTAPTARAASAEALAEIARQRAPNLAVEVVPNPSDALARAAAVGSRVVIAGSIFLIGPLRAILRES
jgi:dihydrofolate synthase/folylpolyglutamate synthase